jgi:uncharacterized protein YjbI with pentapeptide repeats
VPRRYHRSTDQRIDGANVKQQIVSRYDRAKVLFECDVPDEHSGMAMRYALEKASQSGAYLRGANLSGADLSGADLSDANLSGADLRYADLSGAYLRGADLRYADLRYADLSGADLSDADLRGAYLRGANLSGADLSDADLRYADLSDANLSGAYLRGANLSGADLSDANLRGAKNADYSIAMTRILPEGDLIGWKKCQGDVIVKLRIPADARRSHAFGRKCRAEFADVLEVIGAEVGIGLHDNETHYVAGQRVTPHAWEEDWMQECAAGIHFYITRIEAENH